MTRRILMFILFVLAAFTPLQGGIWDKIKNTFVAKEHPKPPTIRVLVAHDRDSALLEVRGKYNVYDPYKHERLAVRFLGKSQRIHSMSSGLRWGEEFPGVYQLQIVPDTNQTVTMIDGIPYKGSVYVYDVGGKISIVNEIEIEDYLQAALPKNFEGRIGEEGLAAATIAARTNAYYQAYSGKNPYWHVDGRQIDFQGESYAGTNPVIEETIHSTRYMVLSQTGIYEGVLTPFPVEIVDSGNFKGFEQNTLSLEEIQIMADRGENAAKILSQFFPDASIELTHRDHGNADQIAEVRVNRSGTQCHR